MQKYTEKELEAYTAGEQVGYEKGFVDGQKKAFEVDKERVFTAGRNSVIEEIQRGGKCLAKEGNELCTNGKDTYHEWNMRNSEECHHCKKLLTSLKK